MNWHIAAKKYPKSFLFYQLNDNNLLNYILDLSWTSVTNGYPVFGTPSAPPANDPIPEITTAPVYKSSSKTTASLSTTTEEVKTKTIVIVQHHLE